MDHSCWQVTRVVLMGRSGLDFIVMDVQVMFSMLQSSVFLLECFYIHWRNQRRIIISVKFPRTYMSSIARLPFALCLETNSLKPHLTYSSFNRQTLYHINKKLGMHTHISTWWKIWSWNMRKAWGEIALAIVLWTSQSRGMQNILVTCSLLLLAS